MLIGLAVTWVVVALLLLGSGWLAGQQLVRETNFTHLSYESRLIADELTAQVQARLSALERLAIQRWTGLLLPPELVGSHVGGPESHTTGRVTALTTRLLASLMSHAGIEWDVTGCSEGELAALTSWIGLYKELRPLLHSGDPVHAAPAVDHRARIAGWTHAARPHRVVVRAHAGQRSRLEAFGAGPDLGADLQGLQQTVGDLKYELEQMQEV